MKQRLTKSSTDKVIDGVAGGIAEYFDVDPVIVRLVFLLLLITSGGGLVLIYIVLMIVMPSDEQVNDDPRETMRANIESVGDRLRHAGEELSEELRGSPRREPGAVDEWDASAASESAAGAPAGEWESPADTSPGSPGESIASAPAANLEAGEAYEEPWQAEVRQRAARAAAWEDEAPRARSRPAGTRSRQLGYILIAVGLVLFAQQTLNFDLEFLGPLLVIGIGVLVLLRQGGRT